ncbi:MAG: helix-turn-helix transcriptional regulator [Planctomycetota bacterium]
MGKSRRPHAQHDPYYIRLRERLRAIRNEAGLTQAQLGRVFEKPHTFIHKIEKGDRRIDPIEFSRWCKACGTDPGTTLTAIIRGMKK